MTNEEAAKRLLKQARGTGQVAGRGLDDEDHGFVIPLSEEPVDLSLKAGVYCAGNDLPEWHDLGPPSRQNRGKFPEWFIQKTDYLAQISEWVTEERERSM